ncbi:CAP domain-containing protein [Peribacillus sp. B-H-3]|uniref:CAP domain-containing protein n=1 Tax=Peribacillus sp. B-H-3 TaxID=3400420 RepID=UPI003B0159A9
MQLRRFILLIGCLLLMYVVFVKHWDRNDFGHAFEKAAAQIEQAKNNPDIATAMDKISSDIQGALGKLEKTADKLPQQKTESEQAAKPKLSIPTQHVFTVYNIGLGDSREKVEKETGPAKRSSYNEYGTKWYAYHKNYQNFMMVSYDDNNKVTGLYTNQDLISSTKNIKQGTPKQAVLKQLGSPLENIRKGMVFYEFPKDRDYDVFRVAGSYVTVFYDKHNDNKVTSLQIVNEKLENHKKGFYAHNDADLEKGFEYQLFDLTNAARVNHHLNVLSWDGNIRKTALKHSEDMAVHNYFDHTDLKGQSPFDRMHQDKISFTSAGENLAYGQFSSVFAHEGLMNSLGHRENILQKSFEYLGVGVAFNSKYQPYYTENFFSK